MTKEEEALPADLPVAQTITAIAIAPNEDYLVCTTSQGQIYIMVLTQSELADAARVCVLGCAVLCSWLKCCAE